MVSWVGDGLVVELACGVVVERSDERPEGLGGVVDVESEDGVGTDCLEKESEGGGGLTLTGFFGKARGDGGSPLAGSSVLLVSG
jgi:hypothetical protein